MPTVWMDSSLGGMVVPLRPGHLVPGSLCRGQHPPPASPSRARAGAVECTGSWPPAPRRRRHPRSRPRPVSSGRGWGFPLVPRSPGFCRWKSKRRKISSWHYESGKRQKKKGKKKNLRRRKKCKEMSSVEPAAGGGGRGRTGRGRGWGHLRPLGNPPRGRLPPSAPRLHAGFPYFVLPFGLTVNKKAGGEGGDGFCHLSQTERRGLPSGLPGARAWRRLPPSGPGAQHPGTPGWPWWGAGGAALLPGSGGGELAPGAGGCGPPHFGSTPLSLSLGTRFLRGPLQRTSQEKRANS